MMYNIKMKAFYLFLCCIYSLCTARILTIEDFGGVPDSLIKKVMHLDLEPIVYSEFFHSNLKHRSHKIRNQRISLSAYDSLDKRKSKEQEDQIIQIAINNTKAFNLALHAASPGDTILLHENESYSFLGGIHGAYMDGVTIDFAGYTRFLYDRASWPMKDWDGGIKYNETTQYVSAIYITNSSNIVITCSAKEKALVMVDYDTNQIYIDSESGSGGIIDGHGKKWWYDSLMGAIEVESRPRLLDIRACVNVTMKHLTLVNSPYWTVTLESIGAEVHHVNVLVDRNYQRSLINNTALMVPPFSSEDTVDPTTSQLVKRYLRTNENLEKFHFPDIFPSWVLQPLDLNTDGIDPVGRDIYIHDCIILNDDDSVAVKPPLHDEKGSVLNNTIHYNCTGNITIENVVLTGFGASIGSVGPTTNHPCVDGVIFKNITMPGTGKGIYIKSNQSTCRPNESSRIANILYEDIHIKDCVWWPIFIGPQQQHEPHQSLNGACSLEYPLEGSQCPTQGCTTFENITLRNVLIEDPLLSPGVILGNSTNYMKNMIFENVTMKIPIRHYLTHGRFPFHRLKFPFDGKYKCENVVGTCKDCYPVPDCLKVIHD